MIVSSCLSLGHTRKYCFFLHISSVRKQRLLQAPSSIKDFKFENKNSHIPIVMRLGLNILTTFLHSLKPRKLLSSSRNTYLPNVFVRHNPRLAARAARLRATKSVGRIRTRPVSAAPSIATSIADETAPRNDTQHRQRRRARALKRSTNAVAVRTQVPSYPQPPGAYACAAPTDVPNDAPATSHDADPASLVAQKIFFEALFKQRATLLRAADERRSAAEAAARQRAEEDAEYLRLLAEDQRKSQEAQRRAEAEEAARRAEEERRLKEEMEAQERRRRREREAEETSAPTCCARGAQGESASRGGTS
ncbi:hypothetical protein EDB87DRAFT_766623 [Lactarius vividus]|nr:hypothetical protein EDB87DRAFT_766623 [Lactarius vividus]